MGESIADLRRTVKRASAALERATCRLERYYHQLDEAEKRLAELVQQKERARVLAEIFAAQAERATQVPPPPVPRTVAWLVFRISATKGYAAIPQRAGESRSDVTRRAAERGWSGGRAYKRAPAGIPRLQLEAAE